HRITLPRRLTSGRCGGAKVEHSCLSAGVLFDLQRIVVLPGDVQSAWKSHDVWSAVSPALFTGSFIFRGIPSVADLSSFSVERQCFKDAFLGRHHSKLPVFHNDGNPIAGEIDRRGLTAGLRRTAAASTLGRSGFR